MRRVSRWVICVFGMSWGIVGALTVMLTASVWAQTSEGSPMVVFLEPSEGANIPSGVDSIQIRFRLISPDNTNLMRYQPFINGLPGNEPIPVEPPSPQVELTILWRGVNQFPDGAYIITIKVVDAKGREGMGSLTLYKGRDSSKPTAEILHPKTGDTVRGQVPILVRVSDDRGVRSITVNATQRETSKTQTIYMAVGDYGRFMEVRITWDTATKHPETKEDLFPDGVYLLQARVRDQEGNEGVSNEVLVIVQNKVAQPVISQVTQGQTARGGAMPSASLTVEPTLTAEMKPQLPTLSPLVPTSEGKVLAAESSGTVSGPKHPMQVAVAKITSSPRLTIALPAPEGIGQRVSSEPTLQKPDLPLPQVVNAVPRTDRPSLSVPYSEREIATTTYLAPQLPLATGTPQISSLERKMVSAPTGQVKLASAWLPPAPRTLQRAPEVQETPRVVNPAPVPRLPAPATSELRERNQVVKPASRRLASLQPAHSFRYTVIAGDTLYGLAERFGVSVRELAAVNGLPENAPLRIGQRLVIPARSVTVLVDGKPAECEVPAFVRGGVTVGSFRSVVEASGGVVGWDDELKRASATLGSLSLSVTIGKNALEVNGEQIPLSIAPFLLRNRTFLPLRELGKALGKEVTWKEGTLLMETPKRR